MTPDDFTSKYKKRPVLRKARLVTGTSMLPSADRTVTSGLQEVDMSRPATPTTMIQLLDRDTVVKDRPKTRKLVKSSVTLAETDCVAVALVALERLRLSRTTQKFVLIASIWNKRANSTVNTTKNSSR